MVTFRGFNSSVRFVFLAVSVLVLPTCTRHVPPPLQSETAAVDPIERRTNLPPVEPIQYDLADIKTRGTLTVLAPYNSTTYFLYRGEPLGYEYELLKEFAKEQNIQLKLLVVTDRKSYYSLLNSGEGDIVAARLVPTDEDKQTVAFSRALYRTEPALVQQETAPAEANLSEAAQKALQPAPDEELPETEINCARIQRPGELAGETVHLPEKSAYKRTLVELADSVSGDISVVEMQGKIEDEAIAQRVARGEVEFTVMQANVADLKEAEFKNLRVRPVVGRSHSVAWAVRKNAPELLNALNVWIDEKKNEPFFGAMYKKYFTDRRSYRERVESEYLTSVTGKLSEYDQLLQQNATELGWDWRLFAAQAFQESRFKPTARSWAGATGLLQLMPATARRFGVRNVNDPADNVGGAVRYIKALQAHWAARIPDEGERLKFVLASYNTGEGHIEDAQRLTEKYGGNKASWNNVSYWLLQKSQHQYAADPVVRFGFCRGVEPVNYVSAILDRFDHYKQFVQAETQNACSRRQPARRALSRKTRPRAV